MLLILTPPQFSSVLQPLKTHKEQTGILTTVLTLDYVNTNFQGRDAAERVKRCIAQFHQQRSIRYVLLVGDSDVFPVRFTKTDRKDANAFDTAFYPTDLYYAALYKSDGSFDDWDANRNGYYGELHGETHTGEINVDKVSLTPDIAVGRVPASSVAEVTRFVQKVIRYEKNAYNAAWAKRALLMATHDWEEDAYKVIDRVQGYLKGYTCTKMASEGSDCRYAGSLTPSKITMAFNAGIGVVAYVGHGSVGALAMPDGEWGTGNIPHLKNNEKLPIMAAAACSTAAFATLPPYEAYVDINGVDHRGTNNGEKFTSTPPQPACIQQLHDPDQDLATHLTVGTDAGVIAYLGANTGSQKSEPVEYFLKSLPNCPTVGEAWQSMVQLYYQKMGKPGSLKSPHWPTVAKAHQPWKFMLFGDPSLRIAGAAVGLWSRQQMTCRDRGTSHTPALSVYGNNLSLVWKGKNKDERLFYSKFYDNGWSPQTLTSGDRGTSHAPALAVYKDKLYMVWKGKGDDVRIFYSVFDGNTWSPQLLTSGDRGTSHNPAIAVYHNELYMVWKGKDSDVRIFFSTFDGMTWSPQFLTSGDRGTSEGPSLAVCGNRLYMAWKGKDDDPRIFFSYLYRPRIFVPRR